MSLWSDRFCLSSIFLFLLQTSLFCICIGPQVFVCNKHDWLPEPALQDWIDGSYSQMEVTARIGVQTLNFLNSVKGTSVWRVPLLFQKLPVVPIAGLIQEFYFRIPKLSIFSLGPSTAHLHTVWTVLQCQTAFNLLNIMMTVDVPAAMRQRQQKCTVTC